MSSIRILIVEDEPLIAEDLSDCISASGLGVAGIAYSADEALQMLSAEKPDAVLLDISLGEGPDGIDVAAEINRFHKIPFVFLTSHTDRGTIDRAKETSPSGYLVKPFREAEILPTLELAVANHMQQQKKPVTLESINQLLPNPLSEREFEVFLELKEGRTNKDIAENLHLSVNTVKTHLMNLYEKLDAHNRTEALFRINEMIK